mgnify:CR=1 FL=1
MRTCPKCKSVIGNDKAIFCKKCGSRLAPVSDTSQEETPKANSYKRENIDSLPVSDVGVILNPDTPTTSNQHNSDGVLLGNQITQAEVLRNKNESPSNGMTMLKAIKICFSKYAKFEGKASRSEYWYFWFFSFCMGTIPFILAFLIDEDVISLSLLAVSFLYGIISLLPMLSAAVRRLHDVGKSGAYMFISFIPLIGGLILLYFLCKKSQ